MNVCAKSEPIVEDLRLETDKFTDKKHVFKDIITEFK